MTKKRIHGLLAAVAFAALSVPAMAQNYPTKPIVMVVPFPPGGPSDVVARIMADGMGKALGQNVVIENVGGAGGTIGTARVAAAEPDGYTVLGASMGSHVSAPALFPNLKYDSSKDFEPIGLTSNAPAAVVARKELPAKDFKEFVAHLKKEGGAVKQAHGGIGSSSHMACLLFTAELGVKPTLVAYRGTGPALNDVIGGHVDFFCEQVVSVQGAIKGGTVKGMVVSGNDRSPALTDVPSAKEAGLPAYQINIWSGIFAPKGTPKAIVDKLSDALNTTLNDPAVAKRLQELGGTVPPASNRGSDFLAKQLKADIASWNPILKAANEKTN
ncbi:MAG: tripartite tricarboxylate transporter substrate-binding protein [Pseudolabrys sp.]|nr:tripartite tricarboxylate transporter substrate-binding protein [Pseudolabrys sp.]MDP2296961.1 tripartite tricarboxylate transporter substrate-binding protein [Pseudolabrys sp.]